MTRRRDFARAHAKQVNDDPREAVRTFMSVVEIDEGVFESTAVIDNGSFGTRTIRFETGRLAQQAAGAVVEVIPLEQGRRPLHRRHRLVPRVGCPARQPSKGSE